MPNLSELGARRASEQSKITGIDLSIVKRFMLLPQDVRGLRIVDIGAGISTVTAELRAQGAEAYAVDSRYGSEEEITDSLHGAYRKTPLIDGFFDDYGQHREHYITTLIGHERMPFVDESVDYVLSSKFLSTVLLGNLRVFWRAFDDVLRILKPRDDALRSGVLVIDRWVGGLSMSEVDAENAHKVMTALRRDKRVRAEVRPNEKPFPPKLVVIKQ